MADEVAMFEDSDSAEVIGNEDAMSKLRKFASDISNGIKRKPVMLSGRPGRGSRLLRTR